MVKFEYIEAHSYFCLFLNVVLFDKLQEELKGYKFPVYTTKSCPRNKTEWEARSSEFNCQGESSYACFPNENITELLEFCYPFEVISITKGKNKASLHISLEFLDFTYIFDFYFPLCCLVDGLSL